MPDTLKTVAGYDSPFIGFRFFLGKPKLWLIPLLGTLCAGFLLAFSLLIVTYNAWPIRQSSEALYFFKIFQALGLGATTALALWVLVLPFFLNLCFEKLIKRVYLAKGEILPSVSFFKTACSGSYILVKTLHWRLFWIVLGMLMMFACAPLTFLILQIGIAHTAMLDGCDLSLGLKGMNAKKKLELIRKHRIGIVAGGITGGIVSCFLMPTVLVWLFWMPGMYVGAALWVHEWDG